MNKPEKEALVMSLQVKVNEYNTDDTSDDRMHGFIEGVMKQQWTKFHDSCTIVNEDMRAVAIKWDEDSEFILYHL
jgi:hypothetical protein